MARERHEGYELSLLFDWFVAHQRIRRLLNGAMAESPLRPDEYAVYSLLYDSGPITPTEMSRSLGMPPTTISDYVRTMVERRHAIRHPNPEDQRSYRLGLTRRGRLAHDVAMELFRQAWWPFIERLEAHGKTERSARSAVRAIGRSAEEAIEALELEVDDELDSGSTA